MTSPVDPVEGAKNSKQNTDPVTPGDKRFRVDACPIRERNPGHGRGPIGPCEDISQCPWCMSMCASLRPLGEFFYDHDGDCPHVLHWGSCSDPEPVENRSTRFLAEAVAAERAKTERLREQVAAWIDDAPPGSAGLDLLAQIISPAGPDLEDMDCDHGGSPVSSCYLCADPPFAAGSETTVHSRRYSQCDETCTVDCGHCKGAGKPLETTKKDGE